MKASSMIRLAELMTRRGWTLASCESCTGGLFASRLTEVPGVSSFFKGAIVTYWTAVKTEVVGVRPKTIAEYGVVSEPTAREMAEKTACLLGTDVCVSFTGNAGPSVMEEKPAGTICTAISIRQKTWTYTDYLSGGRNENREEIVSICADRLIGLLEEMDKFEGQR